MEGYIIWMTSGVLALAFSGYAIPHGFSMRDRQNKLEAIEGGGGKGGEAVADGTNNVVIGGQGGRGGPGAKGGDGGSARVRGHNSIAMGGQGGGAGQANGQGGKGGKSPFELMGVPNEKLPDGTWLWEKGKGGDGGNGR